jgi:hypothetical protein
MREALMGRRVHAVVMSRVRAAFHSGVDFIQLTTNDVS